MVELHIMKMSQQAERTSQPQNENNSSSFCVDSSPLHGDDQFIAKLLSRESVLSFSSSNSYYRECGQVPFEWESRPGKPKCLRASEAAFPPLSPPPAIQSTWFSIPDQHEVNRTQKRVRSRQVEYSHGCFVKLFKPLLVRIKRLGFFVRHHL